jgi:hypothetical protein
MRLTLVVTLVEALVTLGASLLFLLTPATTAHRSLAGPRDEDVRRPYEALGPRRRAFASWLQRAGTSLRGRLALAVLRWRTSEAAGSRHRLRPRPAGGWPPGGATRSGDPVPAGCRRHRDRQCSGPWVAPLPERARKNPLLLGPPTLQVGRRAATINCVPCHGQAFTGNGPATAALNPKPADWTSTRVQADMEGPSAADVVRVEGPAWHESGPGVPEPRFCLVVTFLEGAAP